MAGREKKNRNLIDSSSPYYLHPFDHLGMIISPMKLNGENYEEWSCSMRNAFRARRKQLFLNGKIEKPAEDAPEIEDWWSVNSMLVGWIFTSFEPHIRSAITYYDTVKELWDELKQRFSIGNGPRVLQLRSDLAKCRQDRQTVAAYFGRLKILWDELSNYVQPPVCCCGNCTCNLSTQWEKQREEERVHQFLMGLNDTIYETVRSNIIAQGPLPSQSRAYALMASLTLSAQDRAAIAAILTDDQWATMVNMLNSQNKDIAKYKLFGLPNGTCSNAQCEGIVEFGNNLGLNHVLYDRTMRTLIGVGEQEDEVYIFRSPASAKACRVSAEGNYYLWHRRLDTPQQNGRVEQKHRHLLNVGRALKFQANLPLNFWGECILSAAYVINRTHTPLLDYELLHGKPPLYAHFRSFGCLCYARYVPRDKNKFNPRRRQCVFVGYAHGKKGWRVFDLETNEFFVSCDVMFFEDTFPYHDISLDCSPAHDPYVTHDPLRVQHVESPLHSLGSNRDVSTNDTHEEPNSNDRGSPSSPQVVSNLPSDLAALHDRGSSSSDVSLSLPSSTEENIGISVIRSTRPKIPNTRLRDFVCHTTRVIDPASLSPAPPLSSGTPYPIANFVTCANFSANHSHFLAAITTLTEPTSIERCKARLVILGNNQIEGVDYNETFAPVAKMVSVQTFLAIAVARDWELHQMDVNNAFLHGDLDEEVYMQLPPGFSTTSSGKVCRLRRSSYGLSQAPRNWFAKLAGALKSFGFVQSYADYSLFTFERHDISIHVLIYVDDLIIAGNNTTAISTFKAYLSCCFHMKDLGVLKYFLGIEISRGPTGMFLSQRKYTLDILAETGLLGAKPAPSPIDQNHRLALDDGPMYSDLVQYRKLIGRLIYLTITRPELCYSVHVLAQFMQCPREIHWEVAIRVLRYLKGHQGQGIFLRRDSALQLIAYCDSDWGACPLTRRSPTEYQSIAFTCCELTWLKALLKSLGVSHSLPTRLYCDSQARLHIAANPVFHERTKHIEIDCHYVQDQIHAGHITASHVRTSEQLADIFTKPLGRHQFENILRKLGIRRDLHAPT
ncbi:retrovirus-related pol polyprotein from transposon RE1 [Citrus sinensis]|uniref:Retrovirus-related pol polyprotein from transposon RE1 n=1 Tax=Citrus sinensis TaxID=2711 RepID=A0ACB8HVL6_CITSI|nr:retrovirus-related pol polyprotein from transposon RE1 [Citrus sinensis]